MMSYDRPVYVKAHKLGVGITALHDETGNNIFNKEKVYVSGAYFTQYEKYIIKLGVQAGYVHSNIKLGNEIWPDQYNRMLGIFEPNAGSGENISNNVSYFDLNTGISCKIILPRINPQFGISVHHLNAPKIYYTSVSTKLKQVVTLHGSADWLLNQKIYITPTFVYKTNFGENFMVYGASCSYKFAGSFLEKSIFTGIDIKNSYSQMSALSIFGGIRYNQWQFGASYDYNLSKSGFAINGPLVIYIRYISLSSRIQNFSMPCSRF
jgi:type IX secretion system PorP/SprF family membrane protein